MLLEVEAKLRWIFDYLKLLKYRTGQNYLTARYEC